MERPYLVNLCFALKNSAIIEYTPNTNIKIDTYLTYGSNNLSLNRMIANLSLNRYNTKEVNIETQKTTLNVLNK
ncbi:MAG: hypothetical protein Wins2KO_04470 [Winogradskyella sp.]